MSKVICDSDFIEWMCSKQRKIGKGIDNHIELWGVEEEKRGN